MEIRRGENQAAAPKWVYAALFAVSLAACLFLIATSGGSVEEIQEEKPAPVIDIRQAEVTAEPVVEVVEETEEPEPAVPAGYFLDDVPLSYELQEYLHLACEESNVPYALALSVIEMETKFGNKTSADGHSQGYMQVQARWHRGRMERLGVTDLMDPQGNFRVGCDILAELLGKYSMEEALTAYNSGSPGYGSYSRTVMGYYDKWKGLVGDGVSGIKG